MGIPMAKLECYTAIELPDVGWGRKYYAWASEKLRDTKPEDKWLPVMLVSQFDYRGDPAEAQRGMAELLHSLLTTGRPPPHFTKIFGCRANDSGGTGSRD